jgi:8-oxo-dGTP diphosphatase
MSLPHYTLCFLTRGADVLLLHRNWPPNQGLWNGVGGHIEPGETPRAAILREVQEETGFTLSEVHYAGLITWQGFETGAGGLYVFTAAAPPGPPVAGSEGELAWKPREWLFTSDEVVSNLHIVAPAILDGAPPQVYAFNYQGSIILSSAILPLPEWADIDRPFVEPTP